MNLDEIDKKIVMLLQRDAKITTKQLAFELGLSLTPVFERIKRLEKSGVIMRYAAIIDRQKVGKELVAFCNVSLKQHSQNMIQLFEQEVVKLPEVVECFHIAGMFDYMLKVVTKNMDSYHQFIYKKLASLENIGNVRSSFVMKELKPDNILELE